MNILLTGATGFIGRHVLRYLLKNKHTVIATAHQAIEELDSSFPLEHVQYIPFKTESDHFELSKHIRIPENVIHLAWEGLPDYHSEHHLKKVLPVQQKFLEDLLRHGCRKLTVSGTCLEYGLQEGCLREEAPLKPNTAYGQAKTALHQHLISLQTSYKFELLWLRLFYTYGPGQNPRSLIPMLEAAIAEGRKSFDMSHGQQIRDFLPVEQLADYICKLSTGDFSSQSLNICSGQAVKVIDFVKNYLEKQHYQLELNTGIYPVPDYEATAFWGCTDRLRKLLAE